MLALLLTVMWGSPAVLLRQDPEVSNWTRALAWSPSGTELAVGTWYGAIQIVDTHGQILRILQKESGAPILALAWSPDGHYIASGDHAGLAIIWDAETGKQVTSFPNLGSVDDLAWHPDGTQLAISSWSWECVTIFDTTTGDAVFETIVSEARSVAWSPDGNLLAIGSFNAVEIWAPDTSPDQPVKILSTDSIYIYVLDLTWSFDQTRIASAQAYSGGDRYSINLWDVNTGELISTYEVSQEGVSFSASWSPDNRYLASASTGGIVRVWDTASGQTVEIIQEDTRLFEVDWSPDGTEFVYGTEGGVANTILFLRE